MAKKAKRTVRRTDMSKLKAKAEQLSSQYWKATQGRNVIRVLPPWSSAGEYAGVFYFEYSLHYGFRVQGRDRALPCMKGAGEEDCPLCEASDILAQSGDTALANKIRPASKYYVNVLDRKRKRVFIWGMSRKMFRALLGYMNDPDWGDITDPEEGRDLVVEREGTGLESSYELRVKPRQTAIDSPGWEKALFNLEKEVPDKTSLDDVRKILLDNYGELLEAAGEEPEGEEEDEVPDNEEDDEEEESTDDEDEEDDE